MRGRNSLTDEQMISVQAHIRAWVSEHCLPRADGRLWSQREIAYVLGITQNEYCAWMRDTARPGIQRLVQLRESLNVSIDTLIGLKAPHKHPHAHTPPDHRT